MKNYYRAFNSFSAEKTEISTQVTNTSKKTNINLLKNKIYPNQKLINRNNYDLTNFHLETLRTEIHENIRYKLLLNSEKREPFHLPVFTNRRNPKIIKNKTTKYSNNNKIQFYYPGTSLITLSNCIKNKKKKKNNFSTTIQNNLNKFNSKNNKRIHKRNNTCDLIKNLKSKSYRNQTRVESITEFFNKTKKMSFSKYINHLQKKEINKINEGFETKIKLFNVEIFRLKRMISLLNLYIEDENKYYNYLKNILKKEKEICDNLLEKRNQSLNETFLLRHKLGTILRKFEKSFYNKFFLLCVKNGTNQIEKFNEEDKIDYLKDKNTLEQLSDFSLIQKKINIEISKNENLTNEELEILVFGRKLFEKPSLIFSSPEKFKIKLSLFEKKIQLSLDEYNEKQDELDDIRKEYMEKINLIKEYLRIDDFYKNEFINNVNLLNKLKLENKYLTNYKRNIPMKNNDNKILIVEEKILDIYYSINSVFPISKKDYLFEKYNCVSYLKDIEILINKLIKFKKEQILYNYNAFQIVQKKIDEQNKIKKIKELKEKAENDFNSKIKKAYIKSTKIIILPHKKVQDDYYIHLTKKKNEEKKSKKQKYRISFTYE